MLQCKASSTDKSPHQPLPHTNTLASLVKGEVLSPEKIRATTGGIASPPSLCTTFLPSLVKGEVLSPKKFERLPEGLSHLPYPFRFSDTSVNNPSFHTQPSQNRTILRKPPTPLPPLSKGGKAQAFILLLSACATSAFFIHQTFLASRRRDCQPPLRFAPHSYRPLSKVRCCRRKNSGDYRRDCNTVPRPIPTLPNQHYPSRFS